MGKKINRRILLAMGIMLCSRIAWCQHTLVTSIPFQFQSPAGQLQAGRYEIVAGSGGAGTITTFRNVDTRKAVMMVSGARLDNNKSSSEPRLIFRCHGASCSLSEIWPGYGNSGLWFKQVEPYLERKIEMSTVLVPVLPSGK